MYHRSAERDHPGRPMSERRVGLFIDFDGIRRGLEEGAPEAGEIAQRLRELAQECGRLLLARVYGDWTSLRKEARDFRRQQVEPRIALGRDNNDDPPAVVLALDAQETLFLGPDLDVFVIAGGEYAFNALIDRLRHADRTVVLVCDDGAPVAATLRGADRFVPLNEVTGARRARRAIAPVPVPGPVPIAPRKVETHAPGDWAPFIYLLDELEKNMPFVGFGWLLKKKLNADNCGCASLPDRQDLMDRAVEEGVLVLYKVDNIEEGGDPVTACKLNRDHPRVRELVG